MATEEEKLVKEAKKLPWEDRLLHKNWKVRNDANIDLTSLCHSITDPKDSRLREFGPLFRKTVADSNAPVQEKALDALIAFLKAADADAGRYAKEVCDAIVAKCLTGRPKTVEKSQAVFLLWIELEATDVFLKKELEAELVNVIGAAKPSRKIRSEQDKEPEQESVPEVVGTGPSDESTTDSPQEMDEYELVDPVDILTPLEKSQFWNGVKATKWQERKAAVSELKDLASTKRIAPGDFTEVCRTLKKLITDVNIAVSVEAILSIGNLARGLRSHFSGGSRFILPVLLEKLKEKKPALMEALTQTLQAMHQAGCLTLLDVVEGKWFLYLFIIFVDHFVDNPWLGSRLLREEYTTLFNVTELKGCTVRECMIRVVHCNSGNLGIHRAFNDQYMDGLATLMARLGSGSNRGSLSFLWCSCRVGQSFTRIVPSDGRSGRIFVRYLGYFGCPVWVVDFFTQWHLGSFSSRDVRTAVKNKVPLVRSLTLNWVTYCIETSNKAVVLKLHKEYVPICMECLNDGTPEVRDASFSVMAAIAKVVVVKYVTVSEITLMSVGMRPLERSLEKLDEVRKKKLAEMIGGSGGGLLPSTTSAPVSTSSGSLSGPEVVGSSLVRKSAASMLSGKKPIQAVPSKQKSGSLKSGVSKKGDGGVHSKALGSVELEDVEPADMSLEEIESRLGSLLKEDTISQLKSTVWKERLTAISSLKLEVEGLENLDQSAEILIRLLCAVPGWGEKNVQVQQQVVEIITHVASTVKKFPKRCVVLCLQGISERVADIKTRIHAMKCLTSFSEAVGPGFIFERLYKIMKEHKNPKVLSEGITWMVSAVEDFGISLIKLKDLIEFCKDTGLQSSNATIRNATIKLIGAVHKFIGPDIKGFLTDVKPALLSALDAEYEKNPFEGTSAAPRKTVKASESTLSMSAGGLDGLPREDISGKITPTFLKNLSSPDWKIRLESIDSVNKILEEANKRIQPTGTAELFGALRGRLYDSNKNLVMATLVVVGGVASAMGLMVEKSSKGILSDVLKCLSDNKKHMRECTINTLDSWVAAVHLDKMVPYITAALADTKIGAEGRKDLFDWLTKQISGMSDSSEALHLLKPSTSALTDKSLEVRKAAEACIGELLRVCGQEAVTKNIRGPALALVLERFHPSGAVQESFDSTKAVPTGIASKASLKVGKSVPNGHGDRLAKHGSRAISSRVLPLKGSRPESTVSVQDLAVQSQALFNIKDSNKDDRERMVVRRFKFEEPRLEQIQDLESDFMRYVREDLHRRLLSTDFKKQVEGLELLQKALPLNGKEVIELLDILLRWFVLRFCESNTTCLLKVLDFLPELFNMLKDEGYTLTESEAAIFLPCLIEKSGHNIEKVREKMRELTKQIARLYSASKFFPYILEGFRSKNNRTRIECVDLVGFLIDHHGTEISGHMKSLQLVAGLTSERDGEIRKAALNTLATAYKNLGMLWKMAWGSYKKTINTVNEEYPPAMIQRVASESAVVVISISSCCMCHAIKKLFCGMDVNPNVYELDQNPRGKEIKKTLMLLLGTSPVVPVVFIGGKLVGSMDRVMASHINGTLVPLLKEAGALWL
ncbi:hypothetical protein IFM89_035933 [Coptis chinensis]|uniref:VHS domain-containing protein n=1 Tax=Coptis chinensis TaxID=261450 RepID=A0A835GZR7_9MAGN|nr:hypothetical protein IFM89_035933 [Coptis chinensis]